MYKNGTHPSVGILVLDAANVGDRHGFHCECGRIKQKSYPERPELGPPLHSLIKVRGGSKLPGARELKNCLFTHTCDGFKKRSGERRI